MRRILMAIAGLAGVTGLILLPGQTPKLFSSDAFYTGTQYEAKQYKQTYDIIVYQPEIISDWTQLQFVQNCDNNYPKVSHNSEEYGLFGMPLTNGDDLVKADIDFAPRTTPAENVDYAKDDAFYKDGKNWLRKVTYLGEDISSKNSYTFSRQLSTTSEAVYFPFPDDFIIEYMGYEFADSVTPDTVFVSNGLYIKGRLPKADCDVTFYGFSRLGCCGGKTQGTWINTRITSTIPAVSMVFECSPDCKFESAFGNEPRNGIMGYVGATGSVGDRETQTGGIRVTFSKGETFGSVFNSYYGDSRR